MKTRSSKRRNILCEKSQFSRRKTLGWNRSAVFILHMVLAQGPLLRDHNHFCPRPRTGVMHIYVRAILLACIGVEHLLKKLLRFVLGVNSELTFHLPLLCDKSVLRIRNTIPRSPCVFRIQQDISPGDVEIGAVVCLRCEDRRDRKSTRLNSSHGYISYA